MTESKSATYATGTVLSAGNIDTTDGTVIGVMVEMDRENVRAAAALYDERVAIVPAADLERLRATPSPSSPVPAGLTETSSKRIDYAELGRIAWHSSGENEGPDVGLSVGLGNGVTLYAGEIPRATWEEGSADASELGDDGGWWLTLDTGRGAVPLGRMIDANTGRELIDTLAAALPRQPSSPAVSPTPAPSPAVREALEVRLPAVPDWTVSALTARADWGDKTGADSVGTTRLLREVATALSTAGEGAWLPIETAPKDGTEVLICEYGDVFLARWTLGHDNIRDEDWACFMCDGYRKHFDATAWHPLPSPPVASASDSAEGV
jgi:hypothetical protein